MKRLLFLLPLLLVLCPLAKGQTVEEKISATLGTKHSLVKNWIVIADDDADWALFLKLNPACQQSKTACSILNSHETHIRASFVNHAESSELRHILLHEAGHLSGRRDEAGAEWWAWQHDK